MEDHFGIICSETWLLTITSKMHYPHSDHPNHNQMLLQVGVYRPQNVIVLGSESALVLILMVQKLILVVHQHCCWYLKIEGPTHTICNRLSFVPYCWILKLKTSISNSIKSICYVTENSTNGVTLVEGITHLVIQSINPGMLDYFNVCC